MEESRSLGEESKLEMSDLIRAVLQQSTNNFKKLTREGSRAPARKF